MKMNRTKEAWRSPEGKLIPYVKEVSQDPLPFDTDDFTAYFLQIAIWPKNTSIEILEIFSTNGVDIEDILVQETIHRFCKVPHDKFKEQREELIAKAIALADKLFNQTQPNYY